MEEFTDKNYGKKIFQNKLNTISDKEKIKLKRILVKKNMLNNSNNNSSNNITISQTNNNNINKILCKSINKKNNEIKTINSNRRNKSNQLKYNININNNNIYKTEVNNHNNQYINEEKLPYIYLSPDKISDLINKNTNSSSRLPLINERNTSPHKEYLYTDNDIDKNISVNKSINNKKLLYQKIPLINKNFNDNW